MKNRISRLEMLRRRIVKNSVGASIRFLSTFPLLTIFPRSSFIWDIFSYIFLYFIFLGFRLFRSVFPTFF